MVSEFVLDGFCRVTKLLYIVYLSTIRLSLVNGHFAPLSGRRELNAIYVFWHGEMFVIMPFARKCGMGLMYLLDLKNRFYAGVGRALGYQTVPVTSELRATIKLKDILERGFSVGIPLDAPKGPLHVVHPGAYYLAAKTGRPIITVKMEADTCIRLKNRWDKYMIPLPFTSVTFKGGGPIYAAGKSREQVAEEIRRNLA